MDIDYENPWIYEGRPFTSDDIGDYYGFVYRITNTTRASPTLDESTSCRRGNQEEEREESPQSQTGSDITEVLTNLNKTLEEMARILLKEKSSPSTELLEK